MNQAYLWIGFNLFILFLLSLDLGLFNRKVHKTTIKEALTWTCVWIGLALIFNGLVYHYAGQQKALEFFTAYLTEKSLSVDNIFVFLLIFSSLKIPDKYRHKVLFWGVLSAIVFRGIMIFAGVALLHRFHFVIYIFGAILILTGSKMFFKKKEDVNSQPLMKWVLETFPHTSDVNGVHFITTVKGKWTLTNLGVALALIEMSDLIFSLDSIPAVLSISSDLFIVYTSNIFAILGLRSLFFVLEGAVDYFTYLSYGIATVLVFIGVRMLLPE